MSLHQKRSASNSKSNSSIASQMLRLHAVKRRKAHGSTSSVSTLRVSTEVARERTRHKQHQNHAITQPSTDTDKLIDKYKSEIHRLQSMVAFGEKQRQRMLIDYLKLVSEHRALQTELENIHKATLYPGHDPTKLIQRNEYFSSNQTETMDNVSSEAIESQQHSVDILPEHDTTSHASTESDNHPADVFALLDIAPSSPAEVEEDAARDIQQQNEQLLEYAQVVEDRCRSFQKHAVQRLLFKILLGRYVNSVERAWRRWRQNIQMDVQVQTPEEFNQLFPGLHHAWRQWYEFIQHEDERVREAKSATSRQQKSTEISNQTSDSDPITVISTQTSNPQNEP